MAEVRAKPWGHAWYAHCMALLAPHTSCVFYSYAYLHNVSLCGFQQVGDHQSLVASLRQSAYYHLFKDEVASWEGKLAVLQVRAHTYVFTLTALPATRASPCMSSASTSLNEVCCNVDAEVTSCQEICQPMLTVHAILLKHFLLCLFTGCRKVLAC